MYGKNTLLEFVKRCGLDKVATFADGAIVNPGRFPVAAVETDGAVLFADLPGYSRKAQELDGVACAYLVSHFFTLFEQTALPHGGIIDKFIGDEVMIVFPSAKCSGTPLKAGLSSAYVMLGNDFFSFSPKIGIAAGPITIAIVGADEVISVTALGNTVNLAARCTQCVDEPHSIKVATGDLSLVESVFGDDINKWKVEGPREFYPNNMKMTLAVDIRRETEFIQQSDYQTEIVKSAKYAREQGAVIQC